MTRKTRNSRGQSMVEYAIGIGCVAALCMVALGSLGHISGEMIHNVEHAVNYGGTLSPDVAAQLTKALHPGFLIN